MQSERNHTSNGKKVPHPIIGLGDYVRLKKPYTVGLFTLTDQQKAVLKRQIYHEYEVIKEAYNTPKEISLELVQNRYDDISPLQFTHGTVVEIISRCTGNQISYPIPTDHRPPETVSLHLYDPTLGITYMGGHPTEPGKPEFVDFGVGSLCVIQKATETWNSRELDVADLYQQEYGIELPGFSTESE
jgi:hypothetical protein